MGQGRKSLENKRGDTIDFDCTEYYINRELSWLAFNHRVLEEAEDEKNPLLERLKFLAITSSNLDEFFMIRVGSMKDQEKHGITTPDNKSGMTPRQQLEAVSREAHKMVEKQYRLLHETFIPLLASYGISFVKPEELTEEQHRFVRTYFYDRIYPVLTPMAVDASRPFPMLLNRSVNLAVTLDSERDGKSKLLFAVVQVPSVLPRYIQLPSPEGIAQFILLEDVICHYVDFLFKGNRILSVKPFRITRNADLTLDEEGTEDLLKEIQKELKKRRWSSAVRLEVTCEMDEYMKAILQESLEIEACDIYEVEGPLDLTFLMKFVLSLPGYNELRYRSLPPQPPADFIGENNIFEAIAHKDILVHHPYESFDPVVHFVKQAADDPNVLAIKQTLYRVSGDSPIVNALAKAAENGKQVTVLVELKARFDEENNIVWAKKLEKAGCHVIYGLVGLKTHCKITLIVRQEGQKLIRYVHLGTGNYNDSTARLYTDLGMFTCNEQFGIDASYIFNHLSGYSKPPKWKKIEVAPNGLRNRILQLIDNEIAKSTLEKPGRIILKMNSLTDKKLIKALFKASIAGVQIDMIVRGICCLRPGIPGISENIRVRSIVDRFLEHSRVFYFQNGGDELVYLSSADWMTRNMERRVEIMFPIEVKSLKERVKDILHILLSDNVKARTLKPDGTYTRVQPREGEPHVHAQLYFHELAVKNTKKIRQTPYMKQLKPKTHVEEE
ncbi:RNA degradosome polyphosphate kinase [Aneurinibacillus thermoaerophilus]|uniref:RNA degradosome polyphosphate kinase n=1 Tax=Aneurinibacillus TaxID=55079 RepID=UPI0007095BED|nr:MULTISPECIES: RNA degradosome polyphosphate kinase [Aneurinibacillus]AMA72086.1 RNA degradosome polyphosphate kinase [Aneurinibacillus sp. XH2]MED0678881.1 RNA degradosome polyphosphate kinase [Aneurinibacillus thermoaerophilus]MED0755921.1 RNA degradosome polyphosphate kinase [Aneurinibacillus thermoaerophilus]MED0759755.1 RNA degradosome polyphosphate kinase [Aneurinibacillus thermoaerophilus]MED0763081.1 RNA degradosome polyphosphate kinase [Aneurinibacillus thermoaerophilus]